MYCSIYHRTLWGASLAVFWWSWPHLRQDCSPLPAELRSVVLSCRNSLRARLRRWNRPEISSAPPSESPPTGRLTHSGFHLRCRGAAIFVPDKRQKTRLLRPVPGRWTPVRLWFRSRDAPQRRKEGKGRFNSTLTVRMLTANGANCSTPVSSYTQRRGHFVFGPST